MKNKILLVMGALVCVMLAAMLGCSSSSSSDGSGGGSATNSRFDGDFYSGSFSCTLSGGTASDYDASGGDMTSNGDGTGTSDGTSFTYDLSSDNTMDVTADGKTDKGILSQSGDFVSVVDTSEDDDEVSLNAALQKPSADLEDSDVNGDWTVFQIRYNSTDGRAHASSLKVTFADGLGSHTATGTPLYDSEDGAGGSDISTAYTVNADGSMELPDFDLSGFMDGAKFILVDDDPASDSEVKLMIGIKRSSGLTNEDLKGDYQMMMINASADDCWTVHADVNFDGSGSGLITLGGYTATIIKTSDGDPPAGTAVDGEYGVSDEGTGVLAPEVGGQLYSALSADGEILVACDAVTDASDDEIALAILVKKNN